MNADTPTFRRRRTLLFGLLFGLAIVPLCVFGAITAAGSAASNGEGIIAGVGTDVDGDGYVIHSCLRRSGQTACRFSRIRALSMHTPFSELLTAATYFAAAAIRLLRSIPITVKLHPSALPRSPGQKAACH
jgi:hypothetical protein